MIATPWSLPKTILKKDVQVLGLWLSIMDFLPAKRLIKLEASGSWACFGSAVPICGPEGYLDYGVHPDQLILPDSPSGALIGKTGGSTAGRKDGTTFAIGTLCVLSPLEKAAPLFVAVNGGWRGGDYKFNELKIDIFEAEPI